MYDDVRFNTFLTIAKEYIKITTFDNSMRVWMKVEWIKENIVFGFLNHANIQTKRTV